MFSSVGTANANIFNNFADLNSCINGYKNFSDYKSKLQSCYNKKGTDFDQETLNSLSNKTNVVKKSGFNLKKNTNSENISKLKKYTFNNPDKIYGITEDINRLYKSGIIDANTKNNFIFQSYNSFSIQNLQILNSSNIFTRTFESVKKFSKKAVEAYKEGETIKDKTLKVYMDLPQLLKTQF